MRIRVTTPGKPDLVIRFTQAEYDRIVLAALLEGKTVVRWAKDILLEAARRETQEAADVA